MVDIILSIKPKYVKKILDGEKKIEFRKQIPKQRIKWVYIYASSPNKLIVARFKINGLINGSPQELWIKFSDVGGVEEDEFFAYCGKKEMIHGMEIGEIERFKKPIDPYQKYCNFKPPQNYAYVQETFFDF